MKATGLGDFEQVGTRYETTNQAYAQRNYGIKPVTMVNLWMENAEQHYVKEMK